MPVTKPYIGDTPILSMLGRPGFPNSDPIEQFAPMDYPPLIGQDSFGNKEFDHEALMQDRDIGTSALDWPMIHPPGGEQPSGVDMMVKALQGQK